MTRKALAAKKARGAVLGKPENLTTDAASTGRAMGRASRTANADKFASMVKPVIMEMKSRGMSLNAIAGKLNEDQIKTASGKSIWTATAVKNVLARQVTS